MVRRGDERQEVEFETMKGAYLRDTEDTKRRSLTRFQELVDVDLLEDCTRGHGRTARMDKEADRSIPSLSTALMRNRMADTDLWNPC
jgi:hypothetical protein